MSVRPGGVDDLDLLKEICAGPVPPEPRIEVLELSPPAGARVDRNTVIKAKLAYSVPPAWAGDCLLSAQFLTAKPGETFLSMWKGHTARPALARGTETIEIALRHHFDDPNLARPVRLRFVANYQPRGLTIAESPLITYGPGQLGNELAVSVRSLDPAPDEPLTPGTAVEALVAYTIPGFAPKEWEIRTELVGAKPGETRIPYLAGTSAPATGASGLAYLRLPLAELMQMRELRRPLQIRFLAVKVAGNSFQRLAGTPLVTYDLCKVIGTPP